MPRRDAGWQSPEPHANARGALGPAAARRYNRSWRMEPGVCSGPRAPAGPRAVLLVALLTLAAWSGAVVRGGFAYDDAEVVRGNPVIEGGAPWTAAFERDYWDHVSPAGHYRPLAALSLRVDHALWGPTAATGWHFTNVLLHVGVVLLAGCALLLLGPHGPRGLALPWFGLALFAVHPVLADSVAWISGRNSMLSAGPGLAGVVALAWLLSPTRQRSSARLVLGSACAGLGLLGALLGREDGIVFALAYVLLAARSSRRAVFAVAGGSALGLGAYLLLRAHALGSPWPSAPHAPLAGEPLAQRLLVAGRALLELARLAVVPLGYPPSYDRAAMLRPAGADTPTTWYLLALLGWLPWLALIALGTRALVRPGGRLVGASALLAALSLVPVLQWVPAGAILAPRFLYLPLLFAAPCVHAAWQLLRPRVPNAVLAVLLAAAVVGCWVRAGVYADRASFHAEVLLHRPADAPAWNELGLALEQNGDASAALAAFHRSARLDPGYSRPWSNLGRLALERSDLAEAERCLGRAVELGPGNAIAHVNLGAFLLRSGRPSEALEPYRLATEMAPRLVPAWRGLGRALAAVDRAPEARAALERALQIDPSDERTRSALRAILPR